MIFWFLIIYDFGFFFKKSFGELMYLLNNVLMYYRRLIFLFCKLYVNVNYLNILNIFEGNDDKREICI